MRLSSRAIFRLREMDMFENNSENKWLKGRVEHLEQRRTWIEQLLA